MNIGRPLEFDPAETLNSAMQLFWRKGFDGSSLQALIDSMKLSKSSFYQAFNSKHELFINCLQSYTEKLIRDLNHQLKQADSAKDFLTNVFHSVAGETCDADSRRGCLIMNTASEFAQSNHEIAGIVSDGIGQFHALYAVAIRQAQNQGDISTASDADALATYLVSSMSGLKNLVKAGADRNTVEETAAIILSALD